MKSRRSGEKRQRKWDLQKGASEEDASSTQAVTLLRAESVLERKITKHDVATVSTQLVLYFQLKGEMEKQKL